MDKQPRLRPHETHRVNPYIAQYASRLATHHIELKDPDRPEHGNVLVPNRPPEAPPPRFDDEDDDSGTDEIPRA